MGPTWAPRSNVDWGKTVFRCELDLLARKIKSLEHDKFECTHQAEHISQQVRHTKNVIKKEFKHLHQLLYDEEKAMLASLSKEKNQKSQLLKDKLEKLKEEIFSLSKSFTELRNTLDSVDVQFLKSFKDTLERAQNMNQEPQTVQGGLIDTAQYLGNLKFRVWSKIRCSISYTPVVLDPNTANSQLILSEDLTCLRDQDEQEEEDVGVQKNQLPDNPERESQQHKNHACRPVNEIAEERKTVFRRELGLLARKVKIIQEECDECNLQVEHISHQLVHTKNVIKKDFKHLHQLLNDEEKAMLDALNEEKNHKTRLMEDKIKKMSEEILSLSKTLSELRGKLDSGDVQFLQSFKDMLESAQNMNKEPETVLGGLIDTAQYLGNLKFTVWSKIRQLYQLQ
ncbi:hypothetical protein QQF64_010156 [Cirrhinus molitorella]|uniref:Uncharacterized protein n=1 Tax=Cirrhinus molitorella TaxID=172907 RepID=A0ABR3M379_9TELE